MSMDEAVDSMLLKIMDLMKRKRIKSADLFRSINTSGDGQVTPDELSKALVEIGLKPKPDQFTALIARLDSDRSGKVGFKELDKALRQVERAAQAAPGKKQQEQKRQPSKTTLAMKDKEEFRQIFCLFKQLCGAGGPELVAWDESGNISVDDLEQLLETVGLKLSPSELQVIIKDLDENGDGGIDFEEFCSTMTDKIQVDYSQDEITSAFKAFQRNAPEGMIRVKDLREALKTHMHKEMIDSEVDELVFHYQDCFFKLPGGDEEYFKFQEYIDLMTPLGGNGQD